MYSILSTLFCLDDDTLMAKFVVCGEVLCHNRYEHVLLVLCRIKKEEEKEGVCAWLKLPLDLGRSLLYTL